MAQKRDYYEILGIPKTANVDEMKKAYRKLAMKYHPDKNKSPDAEDRFKEISEAYGVLSDETKRKQYDQFGHAGIDSKYSREDIFKNIHFEDFFGGGGGSGSGSIFDIFFGGGGGSAREHRPQQGDDLIYRLQVPFKTAVFGVKRVVELLKTETCGVCSGSGTKPGTTPKTCKVCGGTGQVQRTQNTPFGRFMTSSTCTACHGTGKVIDHPCTTCHGSGVVKRKKRISVKIPAGISSGSRLRISGEGEAGKLGGPPGDLYVDIYINPDPIFKRDGDDTVVKQSISITQASLGSEIKVSTLDGDVKIKIPHGTQTGKIFRIKGKGVPHLHGYGRGDQLVVVTVKTPEKLTAHQKELLRQLAQSFGETIHSKSGGILDKVVNGVKEHL
ncbi:MAG: molecular chaperone DnaJ [Methanosarcinales archaeon]|nr:MAG: molecular chaperone DnaJ [Methanosarcinales archaeon]